MTGDYRNGYNSFVAQMVQAYAQVGVAGFGTPGIFWQDNKLQTQWPASRLPERGGLAFATQEQDGVLPHMPKQHRAGRSR